MKILREIHEPNKTIILSTHDVHFAYDGQAMKSLS